ncbi:MAG: tetratricopeptide repeat protein [Deltaproteobacteria bacterium]|nr:tetratricopeptide repeat protein [Deltaproteobacteria bacterium]
MRTILLMIFFSFLYPTSSIGVTKGSYHDMGVRGYELVLDMRYDDADKIFDEMIRMEPDNPEGYLCKSQSFFHYWQYTFTTPDQESFKSFKNLLFKTKSIAEKAADSEDIDTLFILGSAYGNIGLYYANTNKWLRAFWYGRKGIGYIREVIDKDPEYYNAYFLLGMYNYYAATLPRVIKSLSFLLGGSEGDREKGIEQLILSSSGGDLKGDAKIFLADSVYFHEKRYEDALPLLEELVKAYPNNHYLALELGATYRKLGRHDLSVRTLTFSLQSESIKKFPVLHGYIYYTLGGVYFGMNRFDQAIQAYKKACDISENINGYLPDQYDAWSLYETGNAFEMKGSIDNACDCYSRIKENNKRVFEYARARLENPLTPPQKNLILGVNFLRYKKYPEAEEILRALAASELDKDSADNTFKAEACVSLGELEYHLKKYHDAIETLKKVFSFFDVRKDWIKPWAHYWLACCYSEMGDAENAVREYDKAYEYNDYRLRLKIDQARTELKQD